MSVNAHIRRCTDVSYQLWQLKQTNQNCIYFTSSLQMWKTILFEVLDGMCLCGKKKTLKCVNYRTYPGPQSIGYRNWGQSLTCVPLASVERLTSAAHLLPGFITGFQLLPGHMATEPSLDLGSCLVGLWVIQGDVHDVLFLLWLAALLLLP